MVVITVQEVKHRKLNSRIKFSFLSHYFVYSLMKLQKKKKKKSNNFSLMNG